MKINLKALAAVLSLLVSGSVFSMENAEGRVTVMEPTYLPNRVSFSISGSSPSCPAGSWLSWLNPDLSNNKAVYSTLLAAMMAKKIVRLYLDDGTCEVKFIHLIEQDAV